MTRSVTSTYRAQTWRPFPTQPKRGRPQQRRQECSFFNPPQIEVPQWYNCCVQQVSPAFDLPFLHCPFLAQATYEVVKMQHLLLNEDIPEDAGDVETWTNIIAEHMNLVTKEKII